jgi:transcriptional repressor NF-X1
MSLPLVGSQTTPVGDKNNPRRTRRSASVDDRPGNSSPRHHHHHRRRQRNDLPGVESLAASLGHRPTAASDVDLSAHPPVDENLSSSRSHQQKRGRRQFNGRLTDSGTSTSHIGGAGGVGQLPPPSPAPPESLRPSERYRGTAGQKDNLTSTLIHALRTPPYPDCPICFSSIHPAQPTWSCSPSIPVVSVSAVDEHERTATDREQSNSYCWTTFHVKCIRSWAAKSVKDVSDAWRARGEDRNGDWRCPGCQAKREVVPNGYWSAPSNIHSLIHYLFLSIYVLCRCFCGALADPKPPRLATPHSCGTLCSRARACGHPCSLSCHPGPCPPCQVTIKLRCHCGRRPLSFRCSHLAAAAAAKDGGADLSCGAICDKQLGCGTHRCEQPCHPGECEPCAVTDVSKCYCGKVEREVRCGEGEAKQCVLLAGEKSWIGKFICDNMCDRQVVRDLVFLFFDLKQTF